MSSKSRKRRSTLIMYGSFVLVILALVLYIVLRRSDRMQYGLPEMERVSGGSITSILLEDRDSGTIEMSKAGDSWYILPNRYRVDPSMAGDMVEALEDFRLTDLVSTSRSYERYELDDERGLRVVAGDGDTAAIEFILGKRAPSFNHTYVRLPDDGNVYHAAADLRRVFDRDVDALRDKNVLTFQKEDVVRLSVTLPEREFLLTKSSSQVSTESQSAQGPEWSASDGSQWSAEKVDELLDRIDDLRCSSFIDAGEELGEPLVVLQISTQNEHMLYLFEKDEGGYPARSTQTGFPFYLSEFLGDSILETLTGDVVDD